MAHGLGAGVVSLSSGTNVASQAAWPAAAMSTAHCGGCAGARPSSSSAAVAKPHACQGSKPAEYSYGSGTKKPDEFCQALIMPAQASASAALMFSWPTRHSSCTTSAAAYSDGTRCVRS